MQGWKENYPWLELAFTQIGPGAKAASEGWRARIEDELKTTLDFKVRADGTATVWCGMTGHDFHHEPTPKELLEGLADAYRKELKRVGSSYPTRTGTWRMGSTAATEAEQPPDSVGRVTVATRDGPVEISQEAYDTLLDEIRSRGGGEVIVHGLAGSPSLVDLDWGGKITLFDALWALSERAGGDDRIDPQLRVLRERLRKEIAAGPTGA